jgi:GntR family transcriptional regulator
MSRWPDQPRILRSLLSGATGKAKNLQLVDGISKAVASGMLQPGDQLPSVRTIAKELRINRHTAAKAYAVLTAQGLVRTVKGRGCYISRPIGISQNRAARVELFEAALEESVLCASHLQIGRAHFLHVAAERFDFLQQGRRAFLTMHRSG